MGLHGFQGRGSRPRLTNRCSWLLDGLGQRQIVNNARPSLLRLSAMISYFFTGSAALLIVKHGFRYCFAHFKLCAHFLEACSKRFNLLLLLRDGRFLLRRTRF